MNKKEPKNRVIWYKSLSFNILLWFIPLVVLPVLFISYDSYKNSVRSIEQTSYHDIRQASILEKKFINNWFHYRETDISSWSSSTLHRDFLSYLIYDFKDSNISLINYIDSDSYISSTILMEEDMMKLVQTYDYLYDVFLIDKSGNILYTVEKEDDLGTNLVTGKYASTKFASAFKATLEDSKIHFSDLELYKPSNNIVAGFFTAPIKNDNGSLLGILAIQVKLNKIYSLFDDEKFSNNNFSHYLVGEDGLLRSKIDKMSEVLKLKVDTEQFHLWDLEHGEHGENDTDEDETIFIYKDSFGNDVFGLHQDINILGVKWALFSESKLNLVTKLTQNVIDKTLTYLIMIAIIVIIVAMLISYLFVQPILLLSSITTRFAEGERNIKIDINSSNEIGLLAKRVQEMIDSIKQGENELDEQKHALNAHAIVAITNVSGTITYVNEKFVEISGYEREELIGNNHRILNSGDKSKEYWKNMYAVISNGEVWHDEIRNIAKDGSYYWVSTTIVPFMDDANKPRSYIAIRTDITEKKADEIALRRAKLIADESVKAKSEFFASMSHEIRTPMNGVIGMLGLLLNTDLNESQRHQAYLAQTSAKALLSLINDILDFSKIEANKLDLEKREFNIRDDLGDFVEAISFKAQEKGISVVLDVKNIEVSMISADSGRILQILNNLVSNAIKFTDNGYVFIKVSLYDISEKEARLHILVKDTGIGIPKDKIEALFDSFSQVDASTTRKYGGTGLGLAIVKKLAELMNGWVDVTSDKGNGSEFIVDISVDLVENTPIVLPDVAVKDKTVLIVDSCLVSANVLAEQLKHWKMKVSIENTPKKLLENLGAVFDIVFIDNSEFSLELGKKFKEETPQTKLVLMTSLADTANVASYMKIGYDIHYPKPATTKDILNALRILVEDYNSAINMDTQEICEKNDKWLRSVKILLVDDNRVNQLVANGILEEMGLEADVANNGLEALHAIKRAGEEQYDLILMDCQMPEMDGYEATEILKSQEATQNIPIIAMTANAMDGDREKCFASGMDDYISKPIDPEKLEEILRKYLT